MRVVDAEDSRARTWVLKGGIVGSQIEIRRRRRTTTRSWVGEIAAGSKCVVCSEYRWVYTWVSELYLIESTPGGYRSVCVVRETWRIEIEEGVHMR